MRHDKPAPNWARDLFRELSNRGRWGDDDELGTLNYITPGKVLGAARLVRRGRVVSIGKDIDTAASSINPRPAVHRMLYTGHEPISTSDELTLAPHGFVMTHLDALAHVYFDGEVYNGRRAGDVVQRDGLRFGSIYAQRDGIVTRGVLLDVARARGVRWLEVTDAVGPDDLEAAERHGGVRVESGDAVFARTGEGSRVVTEGRQDLSAWAGLTVECLRWLHEREVALYSGDCIEQFPSPHPGLALPLHMIGLAAMGLVLLDWTDMEVLGRVCEDEKRREFMLSVAPLRIPRGTGSPVNPLCLF